MPGVGRILVAAIKIFQVRHLDGDCVVSTALSASALAVFIPARKLLKVSAVVQILQE
jgi:hypothetical protein